MSEAERGPLVGEVTDFLSSLRNEFPELYSSPRPSPPKGERENDQKSGEHDRETAGLLLKERVGHWAALMGLDYGRVFIKDQRSLWGSCSTKGNLNFNWRLAFAPKEVLDYVVIHELAHRREMNHSKRFWAVVAGYCPGFREHRRWLNDNHRALRRRREAVDGAPRACYNGDAERPGGRSAA